MELTERYITCDNPFVAIVAGKQVLIDCFCINKDGKTLSPCIIDGVKLEIVPIKNYTHIESLHEMRAKEMNQAILEAKYCRC